MIVEFLHIFVWFDHLHQCWILVLCWEALRFAPVCVFTHYWGMFWLLPACDLLYTGLL